MVSDTSKILNHINWKPKFNNLESIITSSVEWEKYLNEKIFKRKFKRNDNKHLLLYGFKEHKEKQGLNLK